MKHSNRIFRIMVVAVILSLVMSVMPAIPALAAAITLSPTSGPPATQVTVTGTGFTVNHDIEFTFDDQSRGSLVLTGSTFSYTITVPTGKAAGDYLVKCIDWSLTNPSVVASASFTVTGEGSTTAGDADIDLYPRKGTVGTEVEIEGTEFGDREDIIVEYDGDEIDIDSGDNDTDRDGDFTCYIIIPESSAGDHTITVIGDESEAEAEADFDVEPQMSISPTSGTPNTIVTVTGTGFGRRSQVSIFFAGFEITIDEADTYGSFETTFTVIQTSAGTYNVEVEDEDDNTADAAEFTVEVEARADISKTEGDVGTKVTISGIGFKADSTVKITYDGSEIATTTADKNGAFSASFNAPTSSGGAHTVTATDGESTKEFTFTMESTPPPIPAPQLPATGTVIGEEEEEIVSFDWADVADPSGVTYTFQIATNQQFVEDSVVIEKKELTASEYALTEVERESLVPPEESEAKEVTYYWRIKATDGADNESNWSIARTFIVSRPSIAFDFGLPSWAIYAFFALGAIVLGLIGFWLGRRSAFY